MEKLNLGKNQKNKKNQKKTKNNLLKKRLTCENIMRPRCFLNEI
jgi:hypothetical protein